MAIIALKAKCRPATGKGAARQARAAGRIPGVLYGPGEETVVLELDGTRLSARSITADTARTCSWISLSTPRNRSKVLFREVQRDPVTEQVLHVDFYHVSLTKAIRVHVPVHLEGIPDGVKNSGGILQHVMREVEVECLPTDIPDSIKIDVSATGYSRRHPRFGSARRRTSSSRTTWRRTVASVIPPVVSKEPTAEEEAEAVEGEEGAEPERVGDKDEKEGADKAEVKADDKS